METLFSDENRKYIVKCAKVSQILFLSRDDFIQVLKMHTLDYVKIFIYLFSYL